MKNKKTYYLIILDRSGSMSDCIDETISGFNEQGQLIRDLGKKFPGQQILTSLVLFNHEIMPNFIDKAPGEVPVLSRENYIPDGMTALYDAIGESVIALKGRIDEEIRRDKATAVVVIITDGYENASKVFSWETVRRLIGKLEQSDNWTFSYLGATLDAMRVAEGLNIKRHNAMVFDKADMKQVFSDLDRSVEEYMNLKQRNVRPKDFLHKDDKDEEENVPF